ncbi:hypothetical protein [Pseudoxanthomonas sacheonensis]|uniref:Uncharacterized protein n=1 Tax=Pseudoxanthomonas sacheonensis TaxID=443615 RepID=A0ABU1RPP7_9GAMM|nr:hypothetical protein [Pseudoxanthomonas sacheonensis]MDR6840749.1 hypothetical protein [Pseudoxanthomonas sacheonensis]
MDSVVQFAQKIERPFQSYRDQLGLATRFGGIASLVGGIDRISLSATVAGMCSTLACRTSELREFHLALSTFFLIMAKLRHGLGFRYGIPLFHQALASVASCGLIAHLPALDAFMNLLRIARWRDEKQQRQNCGTHVLLLSLHRLSVGAWQFYRSAKLTLMRIVGPDP